MKALKALLSVVLALLIGAGIVGLALLPAASRAATTWGVERYSVPASWISSEDMMQAAQAVWGFAVHGDPATLPAEIDGHEAFPADQVDHLRDVQTILNAAWTTLIVAIIATSALSPLYVRLFGRRAFGRTLAATGVIILTIILVVGVVAAVDFGWFFDLFHEALFSAGTWTFSANSLLISCFPEQFWVFLGSIWLAGIVVLALAFFGFGVALNRQNGTNGGHATQH